MFSINKDNNMGKYEKLIKDIPLNIDRDDEEDFKEEDIIAKEAIAYYPSLKVPENNDNDIDSDIVKINYTSKSGYTDKIYLHKTNKMSNISEVYKLSINENTKKAQIGNSSLSEMDNEIGNTYGSFKIKFPKGFNLRSKPEVIQESFNNIPSINEEWLTETINNELRLVRGLLTVFKENDVMLILAKSILGLTLGFIMAIITGIIVIPLIKMLNARQTVSEYINKQPSPQKEILIKIRELIGKLIPDAKEKMSYGAPAFKLNGKQVLLEVTKDYAKKNVQLVV